MLRNLSSPKYMYWYYGYMYCKRIDKILTFFGYFEQLQ